MTARVVPSLGMILLLVAGCAHLGEVPVQPTALPSAGEKALGHVALVVEKDFSHFAYQDRRLVIPLGAGLEGYAKNVTQSLFRSVTIVASSEEAAGKVDGILIPRAVKADQSVGIFTTTERRFTLAVEWTLKDGDDRGPLWVDTITANAGRTMGNAFTYMENERLLFQELFDDLSRKTLKALQESREIRAVVSQ